MNQISESCCRKGWGGRRNAPPPSPPPYFPADPWISFKDDLTIILLLSVFFMFDTIMLVD
jgi:hypothetical protein